GAREAAGKKPPAEAVRAEGGEVISGQHLVKRRAFKDLPYRNGHNATMFTLLKIADLVRRILGKTKHHEEPRSTVLPPHGGFKTVDVRTPGLLLFDLNRIPIEGRVVHEVELPGGTLAALACLRLRNRVDAAVDSPVAGLLRVWGTAQRDHRPVLELERRNGPQPVFVPRQVTQEEIRSLPQFALLGQSV